MQQFDSQEFRRSQGEPFRRCEENPISKVA